MQSIEIVCISIAHCFVSSTFFKLQWLLVTCSFVALSHSSVAKGKLEHPTVQILEPQDSPAPQATSLQPFNRSSSQTKMVGFNENKIKIFQVGKQALTFISADQPGNNIEILFTRIEYTVKGEKEKDCFGIFFRSKSNPKTAQATVDNHKMLCYICKCADESVCTEIIQAVKQACHSVLNGPEPMLEFHSLCRRINKQIAKNDINRYRNAIITVHNLIGDAFYELEQKKFRDNVDYALGRIPPHSKYDRLVITVEMARQIFEERQHVYDLKAHEVHALPTTNIASKFSFLKDKAKSFWDKRRSPINAAQHALVHSEKKKSGANLAPKRIKSNPSLGSMKSSVQSFTTVRTQASGSRLATNTNSPSPTKAVGDEEKKHFAPPAAASKSRPHGLFVFPSMLNTAAASTSTGSVASTKGKSHSSPYLRRLFHVLPDVQETSAEDIQSDKLKPARFSFSKLFQNHDGDGKSFISPLAKSNDHGAVEMTSFSFTKTRGKVRHKSGGSVTRPQPPRITSVRYHSDHEQTSDVSSDEDDQGIFFTAKPSARKALPLVPEVSGSLENAFSMSPVLHQFSERKQSAFVEVKPQIKLPVEETAESETSAPSTTSEKCPVAVARVGINEVCFEVEPELEANRSSITFRINPIETIPADELFARPKKELTIHQRIFSKIGCARAKPSDGGSLNIKDFKRCNGALNTVEEIRAAWQQAFKSQMLLNKIENLDSRSVSSDPLLYSDGSGPKLASCTEMVQIWIELLNFGNHNVHKLDQTVLHAAVKKSVPPTLRGKIWVFLYEQWKLRQACCPSTDVAFELPDMNYDTLLKELTPHQHAILIDLGRTFPSHPYFSRQLGTGQLALYNLLKAYALVDQEVGYCQGLSFVAGVLLLNLSSPREAFSLLCHLMVDMNCRKLYLPDMSALGIAVYQLSRLLHDFHNDLFNHFEENDVTLMLFSTPWFLTMFASILSLDVTSRVFDMLFLEGRSALFKAALCLLGCHKEMLLQQEGFENIMSYFKNSLPDMSNKMADAVINEMFVLEIGPRLRIYEAEYNVLEDSSLINSEEDRSMNTHLEIIRTNYVKVQHAYLDACGVNKELADQLRHAQKQISVLHQTMTDMAAKDEKKSFDIRVLAKENEALRKCVES